MKKIKIFLSVIVFLIVAIGIGFALLFSNSSYKVQAIKMSSVLVDKIRESQKQGNVLELNKEELNQIIGMYLKPGKNVGGITIRGAAGDIKNNSLDMYIPVAYKGVNLLFSTEGQIVYKDNKIEYKPVYFKVGKIKLPENLVLNKLNSKMKKGMSIAEGSIFIDKNIIPLGIKSLEIKDDKIAMGIQKLEINLEEKLKNMDAKTKSAIAEKLKDNKSLNNKTSENQLKEQQISSNSESENSKSESKQKSVNNSERDAALDRVAGSLGGAMGAVSTGGQKAVISQMISAANSMKGNPNANPYSAAGSVRSAYSGLTPQEKAELKAAVFSNVNGEDLNVINSMIGK